MSIDEENADLIELSTTAGDQKDEQIAELGEKLARESDLRKEERFAWAAFSVALIDVYLLGNMQNILAPLVIFILQLIAFLVFAKISGIQYVAEHIDRLIGSVSRRIESNGK